jgi:predicted NBD/HSP70 family sugar kinase
MDETSIYERQNSIRVSNQLAAIACFRNGPLCPSVLAKKIHLSVTASIKIVEELTSYSILLPCEPEGRERHKGRQPSFFTLNENAGIFISVDLSSSLVRIALSDVFNHLLKESDIEDVNLIDEAVLEGIVKEVNALLASSEARGRKLLGICVSSPGKIEKDNGHYIYAIRIPEYRQLNLLDYFKNLYHVPTFVYHDLLLNCVGERMSGAFPSGTKNVLYAYIDRDAGSALYLNGHLFEGSHGFAGEDANFHVVEGVHEAPFQGRYYSLSDLYSSLLSQAQKDPKHPFHGLKELHFRQVKELALQGDPLVLRGLEESAQINAMRLLAITNLLDLDELLVGGRMVEFGDAFKKPLEKYYHLLDANLNTAVIHYSTLQGQAGILGASHQISNLYFLEQAETMTKERTTSSSYDAKKYFGNSL